MVCNVKNGCKITVIIDIWLNVSITSISRPVYKVHVPLFPVSIPSSEDTGVTGVTGVTGHPTLLQRPSISSHRLVPQRGGSY